MRLSAPTTKLGGPWFSVDAVPVDHDIQDAFDVPLHRVSTESGPVNG